MKLSDKIKDELRLVDKEINHLRSILDSNEDDESEMSDEEYYQVLDTYNNARGQSTALNKVLKMVGGR